MKWLTARLETIAPPSASSKTLPAGKLAWHLTLDQVESGTGRITGKRMSAPEDAGSSTYVFDDGNVLYSKLRPYLNKVVCPDEAGIATTELVPLRPRPGMLSRKYLAHYLRSPVFVAFASQSVAGMKMPRIIMDSFWTHEMPVPPLSEQCRIVELLDQADVLRKVRAEADKKAERILSAFFYDMFGDPTTNPKRLRKEKLGELVQVRSGNFLPARDMDPQGTHPVYGGNGINGYHSQYMFENTVVVIGRVGAYCGVVHFSQPQCWVTDNALYVAEMSRDLLDRYLAEALRVANLNQYAGRAGQPLISGNRIYPVEILVPPKDLQQEFAGHVQVVEKLISNQEAVAKKIGRLFDSMLHRAFAGDLTAKWREAHMKELLQEMESQAKVLQRSEESS